MSDDRDRTDPNSALSKANQSVVQKGFLSRGLDTVEKLDRERRQQEARVLYEKARSLSLEYDSPDYIAAADYFRQAIEFAHGYLLGNAQWRLAHLMFRGNIPMGDPDEVIRLYQSAAKLRSEEAQTTLGDLLRWAAQFDESRHRENQENFLEQIGDNPSFELLRPRADAESELIYAIKTGNVASAMNQAALNQSKVNSVLIESVKLGQTMDEVRTIMSHEPESESHQSYIKGHFPQTTWNYIVDYESKMNTSITFEYTKTVENRYEDPEVVEIKQTGWSGYFPV